MLVNYAAVVLLGAAILCIGLIFAFRIIDILRKYGLSRPWTTLTVLISFFFLGYIVTALRFLNIDLIPSISSEFLITAIFFFGALFVLILAILSRNLFISIFGVEIDDKTAIAKFSEFVELPEKQVKSLIKPEYSVICDVCNQKISYSIPDIVRAHPRLERGVVIDKAMGGLSYQFFIRHYCSNEYREIPVRHDNKFDYRSQRPSRLV